LPKKFVAGTVYDPKEEEVIIGAKCTIKDANSKDTFTAETDEYGDFWFNDLKDNRTYNLTIKKGKATKTIEGIYTDKDLSLGDIAVE
jgi:hypothetical protein